MFTAVLMVAGAGMYAFVGRSRVPVRSPPAALATPAFANRSPEYGGNEPSVVDLGPRPPGTPLTSDEVTAVVTSSRLSLRRACWDPAVIAGSEDGPTTARVVVSMVIGADGKVRSAVASGGDGYPSLAPCIATLARGWVFPASSTTTNVSPAYNFVR